MFEANSMTIDNMNSALRGWAKLDTAAGETAIQSNVNWGIVDTTRYASTVMVNSQFSVGTISSSCDKITQMRSSAIPYQ
jgi:hypothetical protein